MLAVFALAGCGDGPPSPLAPAKVDVPAQVAALKGDANAKANALVALAAGKANSAAAVADIIPLMKDTDPDVRKLAVYALDEIGPAAKSAVPAIKELLQDPEMNVATAAANALRTLDPDSVKTMIEKGGTATKP